MPVISPGGGFDYSRAHDPCVVKEGPLLRMWFTGNDGIGDALSFDGKRWYRPVDMPLISPGRGASVIKDDEGYKMYYYTGPDYSHMISLATSPDGINWMPYSGNPILTEGDLGTWEQVGVWNPCVVLEGSIYKMWYQAYDGEFSSIGYATSSDGYTWTKYVGNPVLEHGGIGEFDYYTAGQPTVVWSGSRYDMLYTSTSGTGTNMVGYASSVDGLHWNKYGGNPVMTATSNPWENVRTTAGQILFVDGVFHHWYHAQGDAGSWQIGYATAPFDTDLVSAVPEEPQINSRASFSLDEAYPNPFNPSTRIQYSLSARVHVRLRIFDILGKEVRMLVDEVQDAGPKTLLFNAGGLPSGTYICVLASRELDGANRVAIQAKKLMLLK
jgi:hypothetical protein